VWGTGEEPPFSEAFPHEGKTNLKEIGKQVVLKG
jgi:hypothetical protein